MARRDEVSKGGTERARRRAADPSLTAAEIDAMLHAHPRQQWLEQALVRHPNLSLGRFVQLAGVHPLEALENPALELYGLEDPGWLGRVHPTARFAMLLAPGGERLEAMAMVDATGEASRAALARRLLPERLLAPIYEVAILKWSQMLDETLGRLRRDDPVCALAVEALHPLRLCRASWMPRHWITLLLAHPLPMVRAQLPQTQRLSPEAQAQLARDPDDAVRLQLARHTYLAPAVAHVLAADLAAEVRSALAANPVTPDVVLRRLVADAKATVADVAWKHLTRRRRAAAALEEPA